MRRAHVLLLAGLGLVLAPACGRKGALVLPAPRLPLPVEGLAAVAADGAVTLSWTNPVKDTSGRPLSALRAVEIWILDKGLPEGAVSLGGEAIEKTARLVRTVPQREFAALASPGNAPGALSVEVPAASLPAGAERIAFAVRVRDGRGRASEFAGPVAVEISRRVAGVDRPVPEGVS
jgi:hypothetical protein